MARVLVLFLGLVLGPSLAAARDGWTQLRPGMSRDEAAAVLGHALISSAGRGFEVDVYDHRAELVYLEGRLVTWTAPAEVAKEAPPPPNTWQFSQVRIPRKQVGGPRVALPTRSGSILPSYRL